MQEIIMIILGLVIFPLLIAFIWYLIKSIYVMFQYNTLWGVLGIIFAILGPYPLLSGVFYFTYELDDEDKTIFKRFFMSFFMVIFIGIGSAVILPAWNDHQKRKLAQSDEQTLPINNSQTGSNTTLNQAIDDIRSKGAENMHQTKTWQDVVDSTQKQLGNNPTDEQINEFLIKVAQDTNQHLPIMVEQNVRADAMTVKYKILMYDYTIIDIPNGNITINENEKFNIKSELMTSGKMCENNGYLLKYGVHLVYTYYANNGDNLFRIFIDPKDCGY